jgi:hypothetical protein
VDFTWIASAMGEGDRRIAEAHNGKAVRSPLPGQQVSVRFVTTPRRSYHKYYNVISNPLLWFLQHYLWDTPRSPDITHHTWNAWREGYVKVNGRLETNVPGIWALGDCNGKGAFTHTSYNDFEIVAANLLDNEQRRVSDRIEAYALYIDPPLGRAGMTEAAVRESGRRALVGMRPMTRVSRAVEKGETQGFMKILVDAESDEILGCSVLGPGGDEAVHCVLDLMYAKAPAEILRRAVHIHPNVAELLPTIAQSLKPL